MLVGLPMRRLIYPCCPVIKVTPAMRENDKKKISEEVRLMEISTVDYVSGLLHPIELSGSMQFLKRNRMIDTVSQIFTFCLFQYGDGCQRCGHNGQ